MTNDKEKKFDIIIIIIILFIYILIYSLMKQIIKILHTYGLNI